MVLVLVLVLLLYLTALTKEITYPWEEEMRQRSTEDCATMSERSWNHFQEREVPIQKGADRVIRHIFTKDGLKPSPDKVRAIKECGVPGNKRLCEAFLVWQATEITSSRTKQPKQDRCTS